MDTSRGVIRDYDENGRLIAAGLCWWEIKPWLEELTIWAGVFWMMPTSIALIGMSRSSTFEPAFYAFLVLAGCLVASFVPLIVWGKTYRTLLFHIDGRIEVQNGLPFAKKLRFLLDQSELLSVETDATTVRIWFRDGQSLTLLERKHPIQFTRLVTIQLNNAFQEIKDARLALNKRGAASEPAATQRIIP